MAKPRIHLFDVSAAGAPTETSAFDPDPARGPAAARDRLVLMPLGRRHAVAACIAAPLVGAALLARRVRGAVVGARGVRRQPRRGRRLPAPARRSGGRRALAAAPARARRVDLPRLRGEPARRSCPSIASSRVSVYADDPRPRIASASIRRASRACAPIPSRSSRVEPDLVCISGFNELESVRLLAGAGVPLLRQSRLDSFAEMTAGLRLLGRGAGRRRARRGARRATSRARSPTSRARCAARGPCASFTTIRSATRWAPARSSTRSSSARRRPQRRRRARHSRLRARSASRRCSRSSPRPSSCPATRTSCPRCARSRASGLWQRLPAVAAGRVYEVPGAWINTDSHHAARGLARVARVLHPEAFPRTDLSPLGPGDSERLSSLSSRRARTNGPPAGSPSSRSSSETGEPMR